MGERLGHVLGWIGTLLAIVLAGGGVMAAAAETSPGLTGWILGIFWGFAILSYAVGRGLRYIFAGQ